MKNAKPASTAKVTKAKSAKSSSATSPTNPTKTTPAKTAQSASPVRTSSTMPAIRPTLLERTRLGKLSQFSRKTYQILALCLIAVVILESVALFAALHRAPATSNTPSTQVPGIPVPANSDLARIENIPSDHLEVFYYTVTQFTVDAVSSFYTSQGKHQPWTCFTTMKLTSNQRNGQPITGVGVQISFQQSKTQFTIVAGDQQYGAIVLGDVLDDGSIALRISAEPPPRKGC